MRALSTWHDIYGQLVGQLRRRSPSLPEQPSVDDLRLAIDELEDDGADKWFRNPDQELEVQRPVQAYVGPREILEWAKTDGPLRDKHA